MEKPKRVFVSGCYDMLHSGHVAFFRQAAGYGNLYVGIGSDATVEQLKGRPTVCSEGERLYMVKAIRYVTDAYVNSGSGMMDFVATVDRVKPDVFVVNADGDTPAKREFCRERGIEYVVLSREPEQGLQARSTTALRRDHLPGLPYRIDLAGTWIDQPYVSIHHPGIALTISIEPTRNFIERAGMATSTRNAALKIWPYELPRYNEEMLARLLFCFENSPEREGHVSGAQDAIGLCMSGLTCHRYEGRYWPEEIEQIADEETLSWLERQLCLVEMFPRREGCSVVEGKDVTPDKVEALARAAEACRDAILRRDDADFARAFQASFDAQIAMFPAMMQPGVAEHIERVRPFVKAWKMTGAGGGGYLCCVVDPDGPLPEGAIPVKIRRKNSF